VSHLRERLIEIRFHGRGGQGAWTASLLLAQAGLIEGKYIQSFPAFGPERSGAPLTAFTRISEDPIHLHSSIYEPDVVVVLDPTLMGPSVFEGLTQDTKIVVNTDKSQEKMRAVLGVQQGELYVLDATSLALKILGRPITNTAMLGAVVRTTEIVALDSILWAVGKRFTGRIGELNLKLIKTAYVEVGKE